MPRCLSREHFLEGKAFESRTVPEKNIERLDFLGDRRSIVNQRIAKLSRVAAVLLTLVAWFFISNHCAFAIGESARSASAHVHCHGSTVPAKTPAKNQQVPCCKVLRATAVKESASVAWNSLTFSLRPYFVGIIIFPEQLHWPQSFELDTGPPFSGSFAESVLQQSILAHAPPFSLS